MNEAEEEKIKCATDGERHKGYVRDSLCGITKEIEYGDRENNELRREREGQRGRRGAIVGLINSLINK